MGLDSISSIGPMYNFIFSFIIASIGYELAKQKDLEEKRNILNSTKIIFVPNLVHQV